MGHYDSCRPGYCGVCPFCNPPKTSRKKSVKVEETGIIANPPGERIARLHTKLGRLYEKVAKKEAEVKKLEEKRRKV